MRSNRILVALCVLSGPVAFTGAAGAATDTVYKYTKPHTGHFTADYMGMSPDGSDTAENYIVQWGGGGLTAPSGGCFNTSVNVPNGATITALIVYYKSGASGDVSAKLVRHRFPAGTEDTLGGKTIVDNSGKPRAATIAVNAGLAGVDNARYSYGFGVCLGASDTFFGARVTYTYTNAGD